MGNHARVQECGNLLCVETNSVHIPAIVPTVGRFKILWNAGILRQGGESGGG